MLSQISGIVALVNFLDYSNKSYFMISNLESDLKFRYYPNVKDLVETIKLEDEKEDVKHNFVSVKILDFEKKPWSIVIDGLLEYSCKNNQLIASYNFESKIAKKNAVDSEEHIFMLDKSYKTLEEISNYISSSFDEQCVFEHAIDIAPEKIICVYTRNSKAVEIGYNV